MKRCSPVGEDEEERPSPKRIALSPELLVKKEPQEKDSFTGVSPQDDRSSDYDTAVGSSKILIENLCEKSHELSFPRLSQEINALSLSHPPLELLGKLFPHHKTGTLELILQGCNGNVVETIEFLLSSQESRGRHVPVLGGYGFSSVHRAPPFLHSPMTRNVITRPLATPHACSPSRIYPPSSLPPPLLVKPKPDTSFKFPSSAHAHHSGESRLTDRVCGHPADRYCSRCGYKINLFDKFCAHCGKIVNGSNGL